MFLLCAGTIFASSPATFSDVTFKSSIMKTEQFKISGTYFAKEDVTLKLYDFDRLVVIGTYDCHTGACDFEFNQKINSSGTIHLSLAAKYSDGMKDVFTLTTYICDKDDDKDGVCDYSDSCPNTPLGEKTDSTGCSCSQKTMTFRECPKASCDSGYSLTYPQSGYDTCIDGVVHEYSCSLQSRVLADICTTREKYTITLVEGWNFISIPVKSPETNLLNLLKNSLGENLQAVAVYANDGSTKGWKYFISGFPTKFNTLSNIDYSSGMWIRVKHSVDLSYDNLGETNIAYEIYPGWNMISFNKLSKGLCIPANMYDDSTYASQLECEPNGGFYVFSKIRRSFSRS